LVCRRSVMVRLKIRPRPRKRSLVAACKFGEEPSTALSHEHDCWREVVVERVAGDGDNRRLANVELGRDRLEVVERVESCPTVAGAQVDNRSRRLNGEIKTGVRIGSESFQQTQSSGSSVHSATNKMMNGGPARPLASAMIPPPAFRKSAADRPGSWRQYRALNRDYITSGTRPRRNSRDLQSQSVR